MGERIDERRTERDAAFEEFVAAAEPRLRRALVAAYGAQVGREATVDALAYGWEHFDRVSAMANPLGYLYRVGETSARRQLGRRGKVAEQAPPPSTSDVEPGLIDALRGLSAQQRAVVVLVTATATRCGRRPRRSRSRCRRCATTSTGAWRGCASNWRHEMTDVLESLRRYADDLDTVEPVRAAEAQARADWSPYESTERLVLRPAPRRQDGRRVLAVAAAVLVFLATVVVIHEETSGTNTKVGSTAAQLYLPAAIPAGFRLVAKTTVDPSALTLGASAVVTDNRSGARVGVQTTRGSSPISGGDYTDPVDVNGRPGWLVSMPFEPDALIFDAGGTTYWLRADGASDEDLVVVARSIRPAVGSDVVDMVAPDGWSVRHEQINTSFDELLTYVDGAIGSIVVRIYRQPGGGEPPPGAVTNNDDGVPVSVAVLGEHQLIYRRLGRDRYAVATAMDMPLGAATSVVKALAPVPPAAFVAAELEPGISYRPDPSAFVRVLAVPETGVSLYAQPGPGADWCIRVEPAPATTGVQCMVDDVSIRTTSVYSPSLTARAFFGTAPGAVTVTLGLDDGTEVQAALTDLLRPSNLVGWIATVPTSAHVRWIEATDFRSEVSWHVGRPRHTSG